MGAPLRIRAALRRTALAAAVLGLGLLGLLAVPALRHALAALVPHDRLVQLNGLRLGFRVERDVRIAMPDGVSLAASVYLPRAPGRLPTVLVRLPYGRLAYGEALNSAEFFARHGFAVVVEDLRGTHDSGGRLLPYAHGLEDGAATLDWITAQPWSNGRVGTVGCSALGETQYVLARAGHPALRAMIPQGAGGAVGAAAGRDSYFGVFEGGVFELASGFGWFAQYGAQDPQAPPARPFDVAATLQGLPVADLVQRVRPGPNGYDEFLRRPLRDPGWHDLGFLDDSDLPAVPTLEITTWGDQTVGDTLAFHASLPAKYAARGREPPERHLVIAPGTHCHFEEAGLAGRFGALALRDASQPYADWYLRWFDRWLRDRGPGLPELPPVLYFMLGEDRWLAADAWPPPEAQVQRWFLDGAGRANGAGGDGALVPAAPARAAADAYLDDPARPVPSVGGPACCTGAAHPVEGPADQREVEARDDVLVYTSAPLRLPLRIAGPLRAVLAVASSAPDADFVARLVDVAPDGQAIGLQEGALRASHVRGPLEPGRPVRLTVDMRAIAATLAAGHRLRLDISSTSFPRLERNLHGRGDNARATVLAAARNEVFHGGDTLSWIELPVLPAATALAGAAGVRAGPGSAQID